MAIGNSVSAYITKYIGEIREELKESIDSNNLYSCWNTFDYISKNLSWANDTVIGKTAKKEIAEFTQILYNLITVTKELCDKLEEFNELQIKENGGGGSVLYNAYDSSIMGESKLYGFFRPSDITDYEVLFK